MVTYPCLYSRLHGTNATKHQSLSRKVTKRRPDARASVSRTNLKPMNVMKQQQDDEERWMLKKWDQRTTLAPPPYKGPWKRILAGINIGDSRVDALPISAVCCHGGKARMVGMDPHPEWVDWDSVRRGQQVFQDHLGQAYFALTFTLLQGFSVARLSEVLHVSGYAQDAETAFERYRETSFAILDWVSYPLDEENSLGQIQLQNIRAMHSFARRRSVKLFDASKGEGVALSQYDMAEVLLAFAGICPNLMAHDLNVHLTRDEMKDWCHAWRLIGYHLGIKDEFNICNSLDDMEALVDEWMLYAPYRFKTCRASAFALQRTALDGFGKYTGIGIEFFSAVLHSSFQTRNWANDLDFMERPCLPELKDLVIELMPVALPSPRVNSVISMAAQHMRSEFRDHPKRARRVLPWLARMSQFSDGVLWPLVAWCYRYRTLLGMARFPIAYLLGMVGAHYLGYKFVWQRVFKGFVTM